MSTEAEQLDALKDLALDQTDRLTVTFTRWQWWLIFSNLQLALRHPHNKGAGAVTARQIATAIQYEIAPAGSPLGDLAERGWSGE